MLGHSVVDPMFVRMSKVSIWNDLEDMMVDVPWYVGVVLWWAPVLFASLLCLMSLYAIFFAGFWFTGFVALLFFKFVGAGWFRYAQNVLHTGLVGMPWYDHLVSLLSNSKRQGIHAYRHTALSKLVGGVYNRLDTFALQQYQRLRTKIQRYQHERR